MNIKTKLKKGDIVDIFTDYQDEDINTFEGKAILLKKIRNGDSFYRKDEQLKIEEKKEYTKEERKRLEKYMRLKSFFYGSTSPPDKELVKLRKELISCRKDTSDDIENMLRIISAYKDKYKDSVRKIKSLFIEFDSDYIIRYIQQDREKWNPTIFSYERWLIQFIEDKAGWKTDFRTERNIRILSKINPKENVKSSDIRKYTTYNHGISSINIYNKEENDDEVDEINDLFDKLVDDYLNEEEDFIID
jgi:hypothetical protein